MSRGPKMVTSTTDTGPPQYLRGPLQAAAQGAWTQYRNPDSGSIFTSLDQQFNRASDLTRTRLDSEFAGAGRNLGASYPARSDQLQTLAANIYDPANMYQYDPTNMFINRLATLTPGAGNNVRATQPFFKSGLF